ncbi:MAG: DUF1576 domain-containing protein [Clostridia bacterium]|nr:DUF1576 domain-containing protein [Clostridia bacterium]
MASRKNKGLLGLMLIYVAAFLIASLMTGSIGESFEGLGRIITSPSQLTKDYFKLGGVSAAYLNTAIIAFMNFAVHALSGSSLNGLSLIAFFLITGFGFFGINPMNMVPGFLGTLLFSKVTKTKFASVANVSILSAALGPIVSEMLFRYPVDTLGLPDVWPVRIVLGVGLGVLAGFLMPILYPNRPNLHKNYSLYNGSPAAGLISVALTSIIFRCNGLEMPNNTDVGGSHRLVVCTFAVCVALVVILVGFMANDRRFRRFGDLLRSSSYCCDHVEEFGIPLVFVNNGVFLLGFLIYYNLVGPDMMTGPTMGAMICALACTGCGGHIVNMIPTMLGYLAASALSPALTASSQPLLAGLSFAAALCPVSGRYGALLGVVAGMLHAAIVQNVMAFHGGFSVLNGGFTVMFVTMMLIPIYQYFFEVRQTPGILPVLKKRG